MRRVAGEFHHDVRRPVAPARPYRKPQPEELLEQRLVVFGLCRQALDLHFERTVLLKTRAHLAVAGPQSLRGGCVVRVQGGLVDRGG